MTWIHYLELHDIYFGKHRCLCSEFYMLYQGWCDFSRSAKQLLCQGWHNTIFSTSDIIQIFQPGISVDTNINPILARYKWCILHVLCCIVECYKSCIRWYYSMQNSSQQLYYRHLLCWSVNYSPRFAYGSRSFQAEWTDFLSERLHRWFQIKSKIFIF